MNQLELSQIGHQIGVAREFVAAAKAKCSREVRLLLLSGPTDASDFEVDGGELVAPIVRIRRCFRRWILGVGNLWSGRRGRGNRLGRLNLPWPLYRDMLCCL